MSSPTLSTSKRGPRSKRTFQSAPPSWPSKRRHETENLTPAHPPRIVLSPPPMLHTLYKPYNPTPWGGGGVKSRCHPSSFCQGGLGVSSPTPSRPSLLGCLSWMLPCKRRSACWTTQLRLSFRVWGLGFRGLGIRAYGHVTAAPSGCQPFTEGGL